MNEHSLPSLTEVRDSVINFLVFFTSDQCEAACAKIFPGGKFAYELSRIWFDEIYWPGERYLESFKGDYSEAQAAHFRKAFNDDEWKTMERFHRFFELRIDMIPENHRLAAAFPNSASWQNLVKDAKYLVEELEPNPDRRAERLEKMLAHLLTKKFGSFHWVQLPGGENPPD